MEENHFQSSSVNSTPYSGNIHSHSHTSVSHSTSQGSLHSKESEERLETGIFKSIPVLYLYIGLLALVFLLLLAVILLIGWTVSKNESDRSVNEMGLLVVKETLMKTHLFLRKTLLSAQRMSRSSVFFMEIQGYNSSETINSIVPTISRFKISLFNASDILLTTFHVTRNNFLTTMDGLRAEPLGPVTGYRQSLSYTLPSGVQFTSQTIIDPYTFTALKPPNYVPSFMPNERPHWIAAKQFINSSAHKLGDLFWTPIYSSYAGPNLVVDVILPRVVSELYPQEKVLDYTMSTSISLEFISKYLDSTQSNFKTAHTFVFESLTGVLLASTGCSIQNFTGLYLPTNIPIFSRVSIFDCDQISGIMSSFVNDRFNFSTPFSDVVTYENGTQYLSMAMLRHTHFEDAENEEGLGVGSLAHGVSWVVGVIVEIDEIQSNLREGQRRTLTVVYSVGSGCVVLFLLSLYYFGTKIRKTSKENKVLIRNIRELEAQRKLRKSKGIDLETPLARSIATLRLLAAKYDIPALAEVISSLTDTTHLVHSNWEKRIRSGENQEIDEETANFLIDQYSTKAPKSRKGREMNFKSITSLSAALSEAALKSRERGDSLFSEISFLSLSHSKTSSASGQLSLAASSLMTTPREREITERCTEGKQLLPSKQDFKKKKKPPPKQKRPFFDTSSSYLNSASSPVGQETPQRPSPNEDSFHRQEQLSLYCCDSDQQMEYPLPAEQTTAVSTPVGPEEIGTPLLPTCYTISQFYHVDSVTSILTTPLTLKQNLPQSDSNLTSRSEGDVNFDTPRAFANEEQQTSLFSDSSKDTTTKSARLTKEDAASPRSSLQRNDAIATKSHIRARIFPSHHRQFHPLPPHYQKQHGVSCPSSPHTPSHQGPCLSHVSPDPFPSVQKRIISPFTQTSSSFPSTPQSESYSTHAMDSLSSHLPFPASSTKVPIVSPYTQKPTVSLPTAHSPQIENKDSLFAELSTSSPHPPPESTKNRTVSPTPTTESHGRASVQQKQSWEHMYQKVEAVLNAEKCFNEWNYLKFYDLSIFERNVFKIAELREGMFFSRTSFAAKIFLLIPSSTILPPRGRRSEIWSSFESVLTFVFGFVLGPLLKVVVSAMHYLKLDSFLKFDLSALALFIRQIEASYHVNPYHTVMHAADVVLSTTSLIANSPFLAHAPKIDLFALLIAAAVHDVDHPGFNNGFLVKISHPLAILYNDTSVLENHHAAMAFQLFQLSPFFPCALSSQLEAFRHFRNRIISIVLATDMQQHFSILEELTDLRTARGLQYSVDTAPLLMRLLIKMADIGHTLKPWNTTQLWTSLINAEFFNQGDCERAYGLDVSPFMNREDANIPKSQLSFLNFVVKPQVDLWCDFCGNSGMLDTLGTNALHWQELQAAGVRDCGPVSLAHTLPLAATYLHATPQIDTLPPLFTALGGLQQKNQKPGMVKNRLVKSQVLAPVAGNLSQTNINSQVRSSKNGAVTGNAELSSGEPLLEEISERRSESSSPSVKLTVNSGRSSSLSAIEPLFEEWN